MRLIQRSFAAGELTPELFGRIDLDKYALGLETCKNFQVLPRGPVSCRPGFAYINEVKDSTKTVRLIDFSFNTEQTYVIEFGDLYVRFHTNGGTLLEGSKALSGITKANPGVFTTSAAHGWSVGDWLYIESVVGMTEVNGAFYKIATVPTTTTFTLTYLDGQTVDTSGFTAYTSGGTAARVYEIASPYTEADLFDLKYVQSADVLTITHPSYAIRELTRTGATTWVFSTVSCAPEVTTPSSLTVTENNNSYSISGATQANPMVLTIVNHKMTVGTRFRITGVVGMTELNGYIFEVDTVPTADTLTVRHTFNSVPAGETPGAIVDSTAYTAYTSDGTAAFDGAFADMQSYRRYYKIAAVTELGESLPYSTGGTADNNLELTDRTNELAFTSSSLIYVYAAGWGTPYGYIGSSTDGTFVDDNITPDFTKQPIDANNPFNAANDYPATVNYHEQRRMFANTNNAPQTVWASRSGTEKDMTMNIPSQDDDALQFAIAAREVNEIRHMISMRDLILLTSGGEWRVASSSGPLTPATLSAIPQSYVGSANVTPVVTGNRVIHVQKKGNRVRDIAYSWENDAYQTRDLSILATHLFDNYTIVQMAYASVPDSVLWVVRSDGKLLGLTYLPEQNVTAWHQHETDGVVESVATVEESGEDAVYIVVARTVGATTRRYVERLHTRQFAALEDWFGLDAGLTYNGTAVTTISGLRHLAGRTVSALADGAVVKNLTVSSTGSITLPAAASKVHIGLPYVADLKFLPMVVANLDGAGQGRFKSVIRLFFRLFNSSGLFAGYDYSNLRELKQRTTEVYGTPPNLITGEVEVMVDPTWEDRGAQMVVRQDNPLPSTILNYVPDVEFGDM